MIFAIWATISSFFADGDPNEIREDDKKKKEFRGRDKGVKNRSTTWMSTSLNWISLAESDDMAVNMAKTTLSGSTSSKPPSKTVLGCKLTWFYKFGGLNTRFYS